MAKFWELKEMPDIKDLSDEKRTCEAHFIFIFINIYC